ncbi:GAF domain-containing protein [Desulfoluna butyratoxydans]|uniref:Gaf domain n=1 Tax=Desulfoluna butyratoxydans TaxID=231438 RepID=A0A4U8YSP2_9BACT|nr:GAF domain-containing protein [Desulfoluna butyratoxydans]VFQ46794.1 gaf domain [Desulfoluna butyratoxydans]
MTKAIHVPEHIKKTWQDMTDLITEITGAPVALIMRFSDPCVDVFVSSIGTGNPYSPGETLELNNSGLYCEAVIKTREPLVVCDAMKDERWLANSRTNRDMTSYLGYPVLLPNGEVYGTLCVLDRVSKGFPDPVRHLLHHFTKQMESHLALLCLNHAMVEQNRKITRSLAERQVLRGFITMCANCKSIKDTQGNWQDIESFHPEANFSHSICPSCRRVLYPYLK